MILLQAMSPKLILLINLFLAVAFCSGSRRTSSLQSRKRARMQSVENSPSVVVNTSMTGRCEKRTVLMTKAYGTLRSPGYPRLYGNNQRCTWHISVPRGYRIRIKFRRQYGIEDSSRCSKDYIMLAQTKHFRNPLIFCGSRRPNGIVTPLNNMWVRFKSDEYVKGKGFLASYTAVDDNECERAVCTFPRLCRNTVGSYACDCPEGYESRGRRDSAKCVDINECSSGSARCEHKCVNTEGGYYCLCKRGYRLAADGRKCRDLNECSRRTNDCSHFCRNTRSSYRCWCPKGFRLHADKKTCFPEISFFSQQHNAEVKENADVGGYVTTIRAVSFTKQRKIRYVLESENLLQPSLFSIDAITGKITVVGPLDRERKDRYLLEVAAGLQYPNGSISRVARTYVIVKVLDKNDNHPVFSLPSYHVRVPCNITVGRIVYKVMASDRDLGENARIRYKFQPRNSYFTILPNSGRIRVIRSLLGYCKSKPSHGFTLSVLARDFGDSPELAHAWMFLEVTPPGMLSRSASKMAARFLDPIGGGAGGVDTITRRKIRNPQAYQPRVG